MLSQLSAARPKVAAYPFTTLHPQVGTVIFDDLHRTRVADIPGLLKGAHEGVGLGHDFLRHIERTHFLLFVLDMAGTDGRKPAEDLKALRDELRLYNAELAERPSLVVANTMDEEAAKSNLKAFLRAFKGEERPVEISAVLGEGVEELVEKLAARVFPGEKFVRW